MSEVDCFCLLQISGWLQAVDGDETKAYCSYCEAKLRAHYKDLERHCNTVKHKRRLNSMNRESSTKGALYSCCYIFKLIASSSASKMQFSPNHVYVC